MSGIVVQSPQLQRQPRGGLGRWSAVGMFVLLMASYAFFTDPVFREVGARWLGMFPPEVVGRPAEPWIRPFSANDLANLATIQMLVDRGTWVIAEQGRHVPEKRGVFPTNDLARVNGRYYSVRPPVLPFLASGVYALEAHVLNWRFGDITGRSAGPNFWPCYFSLVWLVSGLATSVMAVQVARSLAVVGMPAGRSWMAGLTLGLASLAFPYATVLNHHSVAAALFATAIFYLLRGQQTGRFGAGSAILVGLCAGLAATVDIAPGGLFLLAVVGWVLAVPVLRRRWWWGFAAVLVPGLIHAVLNYQITGDVVPVLVRSQYFDYPGSSIDSGELSGLPHHQSAEELLSYLVGLLWGSRGILVYSAPLLFSVVAGVRLAKERTAPFTVAAQVLLAWGIGYVLYLVVFTNNYSGGCYGIRWSVVLLPAGYFLLFAGWDRLSRVEQVGAIVSLVVSVPLAVNGAVFGAWQLEHTVPVLTWPAALPFGEGSFGNSLREVPWLGWGMLLVTLTVMGRGLYRCFLGRRHQPS